MEKERDVGGVELGGGGGGRVFGVYGAAPHTRCIAPDVEYHVAAEGGVDGVAGEEVWAWLLGQGQLERERGARGSYC